MAHAVWIAMDLEEGELICPIAIVTKDGSRKVLRFPAEAQAEAVKRGKDSLDDLRRLVDSWTLVREGLLSSKDGASEEQDVILVSSWVKGLDEPLVLQQAFVPKVKGNFALKDKLKILIGGRLLPEVIEKEYQKIAMEGVTQHSHWQDGNHWSQIPAQEG